MNNYLLGCDWGTSSFRLRLINRADLRLLGEVTSQEGVASMFSVWKTNGDSLDQSRQQFFRRYIKRQIERLSTKVAMDLTGLTIVISGMASSSIGMEEVPYATLPFPVDGSLASIRQLTKQVDFPHEIILISGVRTEHDVMRGEETQLIGLVSLLDTIHFTVDESILIFPGTHSKHIYIRQQQIVDFQTFMTGEVFNLMAHHSILKDSVALIELTTYADGELEAFKSGIRASNAHQLLNSLFSVRTNQLFEKLNKRQNALYLSGLLIGAELKSLTGQKQWQLILCSGDNLHELYKLALEELHLSERITPISASLIDQATIAGQVKIAQNQLVNVAK